MDEHAYLTELSRYAVLTPVRAGMVETAVEWHWSSYRSMTGEAPVPAWLAIDRLLGQFGDTRQAAQRRYQSFVDEGAGVHIWEGLRQQMYLGDEKFVDRMQAHVKVGGDVLSIPKLQLRLPKMRYRPQDRQTVPARTLTKNAGIARNSGLDWRQ